METAYHIFKNHPNFHKIPVMLHPDLREKITISGDVPLDNTNFIKELNEVY